MAAPGLARIEEVMRQASVLDVFQGIAHLFRYLSGAETTVFKAAPVPEQETPEEIERQKHEPQNDLKGDFPMDEAVLHVPVSFEFVKSRVLDIPPPVNDLPDDLRRCLLFAQGGGHQDLPFLNGLLANASYQYVTVPDLVDLDHS